VLYFYAISVLPLATAVTLNYTSPLFLALILAGWAGERVRALLWLALALGLGGVALLLRPGFAAEQWLGGLAALASGAGAGMAYFNVRQLGPPGRAGMAHGVLFFADFDPGRPALAAGQPGPAFDRRPRGLLVLGVGGFGALAQLAMTRAYKRGSHAGFGQPGLQHGDLRQPVRHAAVGRGAAVAVLAGHRAHRRQRPDRFGAIACAGRAGLI
jgi:drug/metabolite transporter (DMT)-like permease